MKKLIPSLIILILISSLFGCNKNNDDITYSYKNKVQSHPDELRPKLELARYLVSIGRYIEAEHLYNQILVKKPGTLSAIYHLGELEMKRGEKKGANARFLKIVFLTKFKSDKYSVGWRNRAIKSIKH